MFDSLIKPILLYGSDFWGCLKTPSNNPIENLYSQFCRNILGVNKKCTTKGVLLELGTRTVMFDAQKAAIKNWERLKSHGGNILVTLSYRDAVSENLEWNSSMMENLNSDKLNLPIDEHTHNIHKMFSTRNITLFLQESLAAVCEPSSKLRT